jgi:excisionase family DNA binding protein
VGCRYGKAALLTRHEAAEPIRFMRLLTTDEACDYLGISRLKLWKLRQAGQIRAQKLGYRTLRYSMRELDRYLARKLERP